MKIRTIDRLLIAYILIILLLAFNACKVKKQSKNIDKVEVSTENKTEIKTVVETKYTDTGKIVTIRETEYKTVYDTILKKFVEIKWRVKENISENKAITATKDKNEVITQESKKDSTSVVKSTNKEVKTTKDVYLYVFVIIAAILFGGYIWFKKF